MELPGQAGDHIVLRLARDTHTRTGDSWQVLSLSHQGAVCEFDQTVRTGKCKKVSRKKRKISLTIRKPGKTTKQRKKGRGRKRKNSTDDAALLNNFTVSEFGGSDDVRNHVVKQKDTKRTGVLAADCCEFCGPSNAQRHTTSRKSKPAQLLDKDSLALKENFLEASDTVNISTADDIINTMDNTVNDAAVNFDVDCTNAESVVSETLLTGVKDGHEHLDNGQDLSVYNGLFGLADDSVKKRKYRKIMTKSKSIKSHCKVEEKLLEAKDKKNETLETDKMVDNVAPVSEPDKLDIDIIGNRMLVSRRTRPVKDTRLMNNCFVFSQSVKTRRRRKTARKQPASETTLNPTCAIAESSKAGNIETESISDRVDVPVIDNNNLNCHIADSEKIVFSQSVKTRRWRKTPRKQPASETTVNPVCTIAESSKAGNIETESISNRVDVTNNDTMIDNIDNFNCHIADSKETSCTVDEDCFAAEDTKPSSASNLCVSDFNEDTEQNYTCGVSCMHNTNADIISTVLDATHIIRKESEVKVDEIKETSCNTAADDYKYDTENCATATSVDVSTMESNSPLLDTVYSCIEINSVNNQQLTSPSENICCDLDRSSNVCEVAVTTQSAETLETEIIRTDRVNGDYCEVDDNNSTTEVQHFDSEMHRVPAKYSDVLSCMPDMNKNTTVDIDCYVDTVDVDDSKLQSSTEAGCLLPGNTGDTVVISTGVHENIPNSVGVFASVVCETTAFDAGTSAASNDVDDTYDIQFLSESTCDDIGQIFEIETHGNVADKPNTYLPLPKSVFVCEYDLELGKNAGETNDVSPTVVASSSCSLTASECDSLHKDVVTVTNVDSHNANLSVHAPEAVTVTTSESSSLPVTMATTSHRRRRNTHRSHRARQKDVDENVGENVSRKSAECAADLVNGRGRCEEKREQLPVGGRLTRELHRVRRKSTGSVRAEVGLPRADGETSSATAARKKHQDAESRYLISCHFL